MNIQDKAQLAKILDKELCSNSSCTNCKLRLGGLCLLGELGDEINNELYNVTVRLGDKLKVDGEDYILSCDNTEVAEWINLINLTTGVGLGEFRVRGDVTLGELRDQYDKAIKLID